MKPKIVIVGAGGHAKVVCDTIIYMNNYDVVGFVDISKTNSTKRAIGSIFYLDYKIIGTQDSLENLKSLCEYFIVAIGDNLLRDRIFLNLQKFLKPCSIVHPKALISLSATIGIGSVILANSIINSNSIVGKNCIVNSGVIVDNDCKIGNNVYLRMGSLLGNNSEVWDYYSSEMGQIVEPFSKLA
jgi:acetyltransferase-like isoleucine patch superfamily enzyme